MAIRTEFERPISVDGQGGLLFASCGSADDYLELTLPEAVGVESPLLSGLRALAQIRDAGLAVQLREGPPVLVCVTAFYINAPGQRARPLTIRVADILSELVRVAPAFDFGDLLPKQVQPPRPAPAHAGAEPAPLPDREGVPSFSALPANEMLQMLPERTELAEAVSRVGQVAATMEKARALAARGRLHKALRSVEDVMRLAPDHAEARQLREWLRVLEQREKRRQREPRNPQAQLEAGFLYLRLEANRDAADAFQKACQLNPDLYLAQLLRGIALHRLGEVREARSAYFRAARLRPGDDIHGDLLAALEKGQPPMPLVEGEIPAPAGLAQTRHRRLALAG